MTEISDFFLPDPLWCRAEGRMEFIVFMHHSGSWAVTRVMCAGSLYGQAENYFTLQETADTYCVLRNTGLNHHTATMLVDESAPCPHEPPAEWRFLT